MKQLMKSDTTEAMKAVQEGRDVAPLLKGLNDKGLEILDSWAKTAATTGVRVSHYGTIDKAAGRALQAAITAEQDRRFNA